MDDLPPSPRPRRIATPSWLDLRLVLGVVLVLGSVLIGVKVVSGAKHTYGRVTVTRDLGAGTILTQADVRLAQVQLPDGATDVYLTKIGAALGKRLNRPVTSGELVPAAALAAVREQTTLTVPLPAGAAPNLRAGQRIEVWVSAPGCPSTVLLPDVTVQSAHADTGNSFGGGTGAQSVVVSVDPAVAGRVVRALALDDAKLRAGVLLGRGPASTEAPSTEAPSTEAPSTEAPSTDAPTGTTTSGAPLRSGTAAPSDGSAGLAACVSPSATPTR